ncbi:MAG TPA: translation elongation factor 4 [Candidatus Saccharimonadales bacterium]|nr:translation elongation factor 4 [Candidatus Saccharimonadales bacterium]
MDQSKIRNFCIIAHIDHGKSTLADRILEITGTIDKRHMKAQVLDQMDLEREKGITIKLAPVKMSYKGLELNLIDTPGHIDFSYEVSRSLAACEGALLIVDATQGIQAQTLANVYLAVEADLKIIPIINKIDLPAAQVAKAEREIINLLGGSADDILKISAKTGEGIEQVLDKVIALVPPPSGQSDSPTRALIFDSYFDEFRGVVLYVRLVDGLLKKNDPIVTLGNKTEGIALEVGSLSPKPNPLPQLVSGEIGYVVTNLKSANQARVGDTLGVPSQLASEALPGYVKIKPFVYAGFFPSSSDDFQILKTAVEKLSLSDSALEFAPENSAVLGFGLRLGFLGLLHLEIVRERLEREYNLELILTSPSTNYQVILKNGKLVDIKSATDLPDASRIEEIKESWVKGEIVCQKAHLGSVLNLLVSARGKQKNLSYVDDELLVVNFEAPLANLLTNFYDQLKSVTSGYGSLNYELIDYRTADLVKLDILVAGDRVDALSTIVHASEAESIGRASVNKLKEVIPKQLFKVSLQAAVGSKIIAREDISSLKKDVTAHLYGGDVSRKKKLWAKQAKGKARMKRFGKVDIPTDAFTAMLKR